MLHRHRLHLLLIHLHHHLHHLLQKPRLHRLLQNRLDQQRHLRHLRLLL
jgi:hypothetical protein